MKYAPTSRTSLSLVLSIVWAVAAGATSAPGQTPILIEDFEFASSDSAAAAGVIDLTHECNRPAFYINGDNDECCPPEDLDCCGLPGEPACCDLSGASEGFYSIGTDAIFCINFDCFPCPPGTLIGFRRVLDLAPALPQCPAAAERYIPLEFTYGDPNTPGPVAADFPLGELRVLVDAYGDGGFEDGDFGTHLLINLVDCEGEVFEFINFDEQALNSEIWTRGLRMGTGSVRISPGSLIDVPDGDRILTEIVAIEALLRDDKDPPTTLGKWYVDHLRVAEPVLTPGDLTGDGVVNLNDFATFAGCFGATATSVPPSCSAEDAVASDFNSDGTVNLTDFSTLAGNFGQ